MRFTTSALFLIIQLSKFSIKNILTYYSIIAIILRKIVLKTDYAKLSESLNNFLGYDRDKRKERV